jgi:hypothetical protein
VDLEDVLGIIPDAVATRLGITPADNIVAPLYQNLLLFILKNQKRLIKMHMACCGRPELSNRIVAVKGWGGFAME